MSTKVTRTILLAGNPNAGKTSLFNALTGLNQQVGNYPGVTVDKKTGQLTGHHSINIIDLPGTYSIYPNSLDEQIVSKQLLQYVSEDVTVLYVADCNRLDSQLLLLTQILDLGFQVIMALTMSDMDDKRVNESLLSQKLQIPVYKISVRTGQGLDQLKSDLSQNKYQSKTDRSPFYTLSQNEKEIVHSINHNSTTSKTPYATLQNIHQSEFVIGSKSLAAYSDKKASFNSVSLQIEETLQRYSKLDRIINEVQEQNSGSRSKKLSEFLDRFITHPISGPLVFGLIMLLVFQAVFTWATVPMDLIEGIIGQGADLIDSIIPESWFRNLITHGIIPGLAGVLVFIPQIAILFLLIGALEESGYMARVVTMFDALLKPLGLNGRSVVAFVSGGACAIPAIMSTRTITNQRERLITILVTPFISCSARIPVYTMLVSFAVSEGSTLGFDNRAFALFGLYAAGVLMALIAALVIKQFIRSEERSSLMIELPIYRAPGIKSLLLLAYEKTKVFVLQAGKIILIISMVLWFLSSFGWNNEKQFVSDPPLEESFAGKMGKGIEPLIRPLGFDWKIGVAIISSFAAREVFVGTMATLYSIEDEEHVDSIKDRMKQEVFADSGRPVYTQASTWALLLFYAFAMQCMSTLAIVKRETKTWKWPLIQLIFMTLIAYFAAFTAFRILS